MKTEITALYTAGINLDPKLGLQWKFMPIPEQPGGHCGFLGKGGNI